MAIIKIPNDILSMGRNNTKSLLNGDRLGFIMILMLIMLVGGVESLSSSSSISSNIKTCYFGAGCFWEPADKLRGEEGVISTTVGYCGDDDYTTIGTKKKKVPNYEVVCNGRTRLVEAVRVEYNEDDLKYEDILKLFAKINTAQWNNKRQYQGIIFASNQEEDAMAKDFLQNKKDVVATVEPMSQYFHSAEPYHQDYWSKFRTRLAILIPLLYITNTYIEENSTRYFNILVYGFFAFILLERKFDAQVETFITQPTTSADKNNPN